jgi:hypothetical protein
MENSWSEGRRRKGPPLEGDYFSVILKKAVP